MTRYWDKVRKVQEILRRWPAPVLDSAKAERCLEQRTGLGGSVIGLSDPRSTRETVQGGLG